MHIQISNELVAAAPELTIGVVRAAVEVTKKNEALWQLLQAKASDLSGVLHAVDVGTLAEVAAVRAAYKKLGKDPGRYRGSAEALLRRVAQGKGVYQVNNVVDVNNLLSLETRHPIGVYDLARVGGAVTFRAGKAGEVYEGIGKDTINLDGLPVFADVEGPFGSPTSDSRRGMIGPETRRVALVIIAFSGGASLEKAIARAGTLLETYAGALGVESDKIGL